MYLYYRNYAFVLLSTFVFILLPVEVLQPPFQSPDEVNHIRRAYLLGNGEIILGEENGSTGGYIDVGLESYAELFYPVYKSYTQKVDDKISYIAENYKWENKKVFRPLPNTAAYFPLIYLPQALGLKIGQFLGCSINYSYYFAKFASLAVSIALIYFSLILYNATSVTIALYSFPIVMCQFSSTGLDPIAFALTNLIISIFLKLINQAQVEKYENLYLNSFSISSLLLITSRFNLLPIALLPFFIFMKNKRFNYLSHACLIFFVSMGWIIFAALNVKGMGQFNNNRPETSFYVMLYYFSYPIGFMKILYHSLVDYVRLSHYIDMTIGILGAANVYLGQAFYRIYLCIFGIIAILSIKVPSYGMKLSQYKYVTSGYDSLALIIVAILSFILTFFLLVASIEPHPAQTVEGIQGRYFFPILLMLSYAIFTNAICKFKFYFINIIIFILFSFSVLSTCNIFIKRYWLEKNPDMYLDFVDENRLLISNYKMEPSAVLSNKKNI